ncbi:MAG: heme ABC transporter ATP-binding protein, partial [Pseudomonadota bacterium]
PERLPVGHVPEDRHRMGLILTWSVKDNLILGQEGLKKFSAGPFLKPKAITDHAMTLVGDYDVKPPRIDLPASSLSGGNQQKVVLARELHPIPKFVIVSQPTRGVDIGAIEFIHKKIVELRDQKAAILLISAELEEILSLSDRIVVLYRGRKMGEVLPEEATEQRLGLMMMGSAAE